MSNIRRLLDGLEEMLKNWQLSNGALTALGRPLPEGAEDLAAEQLLVEVADAQAELDALESGGNGELLALEDELAAAEAEIRELRETAQKAVPQGGRR